MLWSDIERLGRFFDPQQGFGFTNRPFFRVISPATTEFPAANIWVSGDNSVVSTELPGLDTDTLEVTVVNNLLTLRGSRKAEEVNEGDSCHRQERWNGKFAKTIELPFAIESGKVEARFRKGILYINLPRAEADKPKKIAVKADHS
jgi:HSP20 family protein